MLLVNAYRLLPIDLNNQFKLLLLSEAAARVCNGGLHLDYMLKPSF